MIVTEERARASGGREAETSTATQDTFDVSITVHSLR